MKVLHVITGISRKGGGPSRSSQGLVAGLCKAGVDAWIYSFDNADPWIPGVRKFTQTLSTQTLKHFDLVHIHGIWDRRLHWVTVTCRKAGVPYVIAPRGMLEPWSLKQKWLKKRVARWLYQDRDLKLAAALHATAESEAEQFRRLGFKNKIIVSPNGVNVPEGDIGLGQRPRSTAELANSSGVGRRMLAERKVEEWLDGVTRESFGVALEKMIENNLSSGNANANMTEVTFEASSSSKKTPPRLKPLAEAVEAVVHHQAAGTNPSTSNTISNSFESRKGGHRALFVSRMHPKKGVLELVESWARLKQSNNRTIEQWSCELVYTMNSEEERAYEQKVKDRILSLGMTYVDNRTIEQSNNCSLDLDLKPRPDFIFTGPLDDDAKWSAYARADLFVLPTYSENFGIVVAEALWAGVPVITTKGTPWSELECSASSKFQVPSSRLEERCGWWIELPESKSRVEVEQWNALDSALREAIEQSNNRTILQEMGRRGRKLVEDRYIWSAVCDKIVCGYEEVLK